MFEGNTSRWEIATPPATSTTPRPRQRTAKWLLKHDPKLFFALVAERLQQQGWTTCELRNDLTGAVCLVGAIGLMLGCKIAGDDLAGPRELLKTAVKLLGFSTLGHATYFNDEEAEDIDEILARLHNPPLTTKGDRHHAA